MVSVSNCLAVPVMSLVATIGLFALLFPVAVLYCFRRRRISDRAGSFYLLVAAVGCTAALVSALIVEGAQFVRDSMGSKEPRAAGLLVNVGGDPSGARLVLAQSPEFALPSGQDVGIWYLRLERLRRYLSDEIYELDFSTSVPQAPDAWLRRQTRDAGLTRREYAIPAADGDSIPAVLLLPADTVGPLPGVMFIPGHVKPGESGLEQMVLPMSSYQNSGARQLALAGFATLTIELRGFGMRGPPEFPEHRIVAYNAILAGSFYKRVVLDDIKRVFDFFETLPEIDPERLGISGVSLGAELAVEYAALDTRVRAISFHAHGGRVGPYTGEADPTAKQPHYCHVIPGSNKILRREDPFLLLAPRPTQGIRGEEQPFRQAEFLESLRRLWSLMGRSEALELQLAPGPTINDGHAYFVEPAIYFFKKHL